MSDINTTSDKLKKKWIKISVVCIVILFAISLVFGFLYLSNFNKVIYISENLNFYPHNDDFIVYTKYFAGVYKQGEILELKTPIVGTPASKIQFDHKNKTISNEKYTTFKKYNFNLTLNSFFKINLLDADINSIGESVKKIKTYNNVFWFTETILGKERKCTRIVSDVGKSLFEVYFSETGKVESIKITNYYNNIAEIKSFLDVKKVLNLKFTETPLGNSVFYATDGTISVIKNKANGRIEKLEIRLYNSSGIMFIENFLTYTEYIDS